jgi:hypothetical protein
VRHSNLPCACRIATEGEKYLEFVEAFKTFHFNVIIIVSSQFFLSKQPQDKISRGDE